MKNLPKNNLFFGFTNNFKKVKFDKNFFMKRNICDFYSCIFQIVKVIDYGHENSISFRDSIKEDFIFEVTKIF